MSLSKLLCYQELMGYMQLLFLIMVSRRKYTIISVAISMLDSCDASEQSGRNFFADSLAPYNADTKLHIRFDRHKSWNSDTLYTCFSVDVSHLRCCVLIHVGISIIKR